ncbi:MAG TPA: outer membrane protein assembly factor BamA [Oligoflexia bacterium]|nr:outer membrane protein assembly factor BamA [Oligoflexia bacterium]HMR24113.1 outer membrane protein assembly factor BamA [Oligoflexia bacterium]
MQKYFNIVFSKLFPIVFGLVFFIFTVDQVHAQSIRSINVIGNKRVEKDAVLAVVSHQKGDSLDRQKVKADIENINALGFFSKIEVSINEQGDLLYTLQEKPFIDKIKFLGNTNEKEDTLREKLEIKAYSFLNEEDLQRSLDNIRDHYTSKGYYLADLDYSIEKLENDKQGSVLTIRIDESKKVKVTRISFIGNTIFSEKELKSFLFTKEKNFLSFISTSGTYQKDMLEQDKQIIKSRYGNKGYINAKILEPLIKITSDKSEIHIFFNIEEGEQYTVGNIDIDGELLEPKEKLLEKVKLKSGEVFDTLTLQRDIASLSDVYAKKGYAYVNVIPQDQRDESNKVVSIIYVMQPGPKIKINRIQFVGNQSTRDKVLRREIEIHEGDIYDIEKIRNSKANIERLALFEEVRLKTPKADQDNSIDLIFEVKEKETGSFNIGAGFNTLDSFQLLGTVQKRNLFGYGVDLNLNARIGGRTQAFNLTYSDPYFLDSNWGMNLSAFNIERQYFDFDLTSRGGSLGFDYLLYQKGLERIRIGLTYSLVDQILSDLRPTVENVFTGGLTSSVTTALVRDTRNKVFEPDAGSYLKLSQELAGGPFGGENAFSKSEFDGRWFFPAFRKSKIPVIKDSVFALHFETGYVAPLNSDQRVPLFERYFPGGILSLRGFRIRSLGPKIQVASSNDPSNLQTSDFVIGGNKQVIFNAEYLFPIVKAANIRGVMFFDMGNAFDNGESMFTFAGQRQSVGFGVRWFSPIGPLRFEWGYPLDKKEDENNVVFDFTIGSLF